MSAGAYATPEVAVAGCGLWLPGFATLAAWVEGRPDPLAEAPDGRALGRMNRRRASVLGRALADVAFAALGAAGAEPASAPAVIGSSVAEVGTMLELLDQLLRGTEPVSPAAFTVSVHNAASGLISIAAQQTGFTTSIAADADTPAAALLEAIGLVLTGGVPVLAACGDMPPPAHLLPEAQCWDLAAAALVLAPVDADGPRLGTLRLVRPAAADVPPAALPERLGRNPQAGLVDLVDAIARGRAGTVALDRGVGSGWAAVWTPAAS